MGSTVHDPRHRNRAHLLCPDWSKLHLVLVHHIDAAVANFRGWVRVVGNCRREVVQVSLLRLPGQQLTVAGFDEADKFLFGWGRVLETPVKIELAAVEQPR